jgi:hypothetical protein
MWAIPVLLIGGIGLVYSWSNTIPSRPKGLAPDSVFLWAPYVGLPAPRRGWWMSCREQAGAGLCKLSDIDGNAEYEGKFIQYGPEGHTLPIGQLIINPEKTRENKVWLDGTWVPIVFLQSGEILIPAAKYEEGVRLLRQLQKGGSRVTP